MTAVATCGAGAARAQRFGHQRRIEQRAANAAVLFGNDQPGDAQIAEPRPHVVRPVLTRIAELAHTLQRAVAIEKRPDAVLQHRLFGGESEFHRALSVRL